MVRLLACACAPACAVAQAGGAQEPPPPAPAAGQAAPAAKAPAFIRGQLKSRYYARWTSDDADHDLVETLAVDVGNADKDAVTGHLMGRLAWDIDGYDATFASINDSYGGRVDGLLYDAYADLHRIDGFSFVRLGRQSVYETPEFAYFDGAHVTTEEFGGVAFQAGGYVGSSVHLYDSSKSGDLTAGLYLQVRPWTDGRLRIDWMHLEDEEQLLTAEDDLFGAGVWQGIGRHVQLEGQYSRIADRDRDVLGRATGRVAEWGMMLQASYYQLLETQGDLVLEADPFFTALNELYPYQQWSFLAGKDITEELLLQAGGDLRRVRDAADIGFYNRDYDRIYGSATLSEFGIAGLRLSVTGDLWDSAEQLVRSWSGDATYTIGKTSGSLGTYYSLYKYDLFTNSERDHVRTYYLRTRHKASDAITLEGDFEIEDDDFDYYYRIRMGVTWNF